MPRKEYAILLSAIFWLGYLLIILNLLSSAFHMSYSQLWQRALLTVLMQAVIFYIHAHFLLPHYFKPGKYSIYFLLLILFCLVNGWVRMKIDFTFGFHSRSVGSHLYAPIHYVATALSMMIILLISGGYYFALKWFRSQHIGMKMREQHLQAELKFLKAQINPHFLFNTLNNIYTLAYIKSDKAAPMISILAEMMRYMLHECTAPKVMLSREIIYLKNYLALQQMKCQVHGNVRFDVKGEVNGVMIEPMLFTSFVENSFQHGNIGDGEDSFVDIRLSVEAGWLHFEISNSTSPVPAVKKEPGGIGLQNVRERLSMLYPGRYSLDIDRKNNCFRVKLELEMENRVSSPQSYSQNIT